MLPNERCIGQQHDSANNLPLCNLPKESEDDDTLQLFVNFTGTMRIPIQINKSATVMMLVKNIHFRTGIPVKDQVLTNGLRPMLLGLLYQLSTLSTILPFKYCSDCSVELVVELFRIGYVLNAHSKTMTRLLNSCQMCRELFSSNQWKASSNRVLLYPTIHRYVSAIDSFDFLNLLQSHCHNHQSPAFAETFGTPINEYFKPKMTIIELLDSDNDQSVNEPPTSKQK